jgi:hypothetical protein
VFAAKSLLHSPSDGVPRQRLGSHDDGSQCDSGNDPGRCSSIHNPRIPLVASVRTLDHERLLSQTATDINKGHVPRRYTGAL